ncbi:MAG: metal-dependent hydrolase [Lewinellaceae bacterium]|nr:metal-dependent hydrolase [Saprospiraceae bacterium]MCB9343115.1 metal-dependent hydrolase [Lewinellaceae bacterium]
MDSLTQIVLGAACGEAVAGKKMGNRAMLWGAVGGTIPDLDVFASFFTDEISSISFHRGFMHSFLFAFLAPWVLAWLAQWFYSQNIYRRRGYKAAAMTIWLLFYVLAATGLNFIPVALGEGLSWYVLIPTLLLGLRFAWRLWRDYWQRDLSIVESSYKTWWLVFFWSIFTHPILDCFTSWGTQIFQPFSDMRVQWCTVSVVDPMATIPFLVCLIIASRFKRFQTARNYWNYAGLLWFCAYLMIYTLWHKSEVTQTFTSSFADKHITINRLYTNPTIFNNIVWSGVAEGDTAYYFGQFGFNDGADRASPISTIPKNHELLDKIPPNDRAMRFLKWFSNGYYNVLPYHGDTLQVNDLRFGLLGDSLRNGNYVFPILLFKNEKGEWDIKPNNRDPKHMEDNKHAIGDLWKRAWGKK